MLLSLYFEVLNKTSFSFVITFVLCFTSHVRKQELNRVVMFIISSRTVKQRFTKEKS